MKLPCGSRGDDRYSVQDCAGAGRAFAGVQFGGLVCLGIRASQAAADGEDDLKEVQVSGGWARKSD